MSLQNRLSETVNYIQTACPHHNINVAVILGSGLGMFADAIENGLAMDYCNIPNFHQSTVAGHAGKLVIGEVAAGLNIACMQGRFHYYEGHPMETVVFPVRVLRALGAEVLIVTNAAGGINSNFKPGTLMLIEDHLNLMGDNPLKGANFDFLGPRFPDLSEAYSIELREVAREVARQQHLDLQSGVYAALSGPTYETPAEIRMLRTLGADAVGMSTVPEVIAANHMGMKVLGVSCITNLAAGISPHKLSHQEVIETTERVKNQFVNLLQGVLTELAAQTVPSH